MLDGSLPSSIEDASKHTHPTRQNPNHRLATSHTGRLPAAQSRRPPGAGYSIPFHSAAMPKTVVSASSAGPMQSVSPACNSGRYTKLSGPVRRPPVAVPLMPDESCQNACPPPVREISCCWSALPSAPVVKKRQSSSFFAFFCPNHNRRCLADLPFFRAAFLVHPTSGLSPEDCGRRVLARRSHLE